MKKMKIPEEIILVARDVVVYLGRDHWLDSTPKIITVGAVGAWGRWCSSSKSFVCDKILDSWYGWMNVYNYPTASGRSLGYFRRTDSRAVYGDSIEEVAMNLQLDGRRNAFEIPKKFLKMLEDKSKQKILNDPMEPSSNSRLFELSFKDLKTKCVRLT